MGFFGKSGSGGKASGNTGAEVWESFFSLVMKKDLKGALLCLDKLAGLEAKNPQVCLKRAELLQRKKDVTGAIGAYHMAASLIQGQKAKAIYKIILRLSPDDAKALKGMDAPVVTEQAPSVTAAAAPEPQPVPPAPIEEPVTDAQPDDESAGETSYASLESAGLELGGMDDEGGIELDGAAAYDGSDEDTTPIIEEPSAESSEFVADNEPESVAAPTDWDDGETPKEEQAATGSLDFEEEEPAQVSTGSLDWDDGETPKEEQAATGSLDFEDEQPANEPEDDVEQEAAIEMSNPLALDDSPTDDSSADEPEPETQEPDTVMQEDSPELEGGIELEGAVELDGGIELDGGMASEDTPEVSMDAQGSVSGQDEQSDVSEPDSSLWTEDAASVQDEEQGFELPPIFSFLSIEDIETLPDKAEHKQYDEGQPIIKEGDASASMFIIKSGQARVETMIKGASVVLGQLGPGDIFGEVAFLTGKPRTASVFADGGPLLVMEINKELLKTTIENNPLIMDGLLEMYQGRARDTIKQMRASVR